MKRVTSHSHAGHYHGTPFDRVVLAHDERHLRRKVLTLEQGEQILVDLPEAIAFEHGDVLILEDGTMAEIIAADEALYAITPRDRRHLSELAWHLGNRHLPAQLEESRIVILRDHVIKAMLLGLGAKVTEITAPFHPLHGAYHSGHGHSHAHDHDHDHQHHDHAHG
ncbi:urease accessory protein UreE [Phyllobacterium chamaecytisi]|uniref:urease accessory protein UreE n=1 Tax=Phyllobacterium chamaecytisi TaxID=2876082 RepID=UPI001CCA7827|nr:urease accessory protein UreE [Phyllobacterium sp. KW56]MBZ9604373.1 urease accessory protein UreE [Phyllobacterium sp. KW56]